MASMKRWGGGAGRYTLLPRGAVCLHVAGNAAVDSAPSCLCKHVLYRLLLLLLSLTSSLTLTSCHALYARVCVCVCRLGLVFNVKGGWASTEQLQQQQQEREAHGIIVPVSDLELSRHAAQEGGYKIELITVTPYGSELEIAAVSFVGSWWQRTQVRHCPWSLVRVRTPCLMVIPVYLSLTFLPLCMRA